MDGHSVSAIWRTRLLTGAVSIFILGGVALLMALNLSKPRIVIVHSLSRESAWVESVDRGLRQALSANRLPLSVTQDYLNLDILADGADRRTLVSSVRRRIDAADPDVLIVVDDESSDLIGRHYVGKPGLRLIYTGLIDDPLRYGYGSDSGVLGIRESLPLAALTQLLNDTFEGRGLQLAVLGADTVTGRAEMRQALSHAWAPHRVVVSQVVPHFEAWKEFVQGPARQVDVLIVLSMDALALNAHSPQSIAEQQATVWTETESVPLVIGVRPSYVRLGGGLAVSAPPSEFGHAAMAMALQRLQAPAAAPSAAVKSSTSFDISVRSSVLQRRLVRLPDLYREAARGAGYLYP